MNRRTRLGLAFAVAPGLLALCLAPAPARAQSFLGKNVAHWQAELTKKEPSIRRNAAFALGHCATDLPGVRSALESVLLERKDNKDEDKKLEGIRQNAVWALGEICQRSGSVPLDSLRRALRSDDKLVKRDAALALGKIMAYQPLGDSDLDAAERERVAKVRAQGRKAMPDLLDCAKDNYLELRKASCA